MFKSIIVVMLLLALGLFAQSGIASAVTPAVYAASDYSALAPPAVVQFQATQPEILTTIKQSMIAKSAAGIFAAVAIDLQITTAAAPQRQDFP